MKTEVIFEDKDIIVCYKPAGLATQTKQIGQMDVESELKNYLKGGYLSMIHRLDQPVEGLLVFAKTKEAAASLSKQLGSDEMNKSYMAVVYGKPDEDQGILKDYLIKEPKGNVSKIVSNDTKGAKYAELSYQVLATTTLSKMTSEHMSGQTAETLSQSATDNCYGQTDMLPQSASDSYQSQTSTTAGNMAQILSLIAIRLKTGRHHQIRLQFAGANHPLLGDNKYADAMTLELSGKLQVRNVALCANKLHFIHPRTKKEMEFETKPRGAVFQIFE